jgi:hypothetical protein
MPSLGAWVKRQSGLIKRGRKYNWFTRESSLIKAENVF